ncbi:MAG: bifunctional tRNA (5-methylaminomethyl-2-thiouridine)(34)-methyltransferase MnmD/FAD-dependent 5-carboxymethylaminomethyl-2-thiouridine(34) oxidoreductase MnmC [Sulfuricellaceae bacterium]
MTPSLQWVDGQPLSDHYGDVYFSRESGLEETRHVFLNHNRLAERWRNLPHRGSFVIGETGFGTGLNFLCAWREWDRHAPAAARLHFVSCEKHPLSAADLARALGLWPELADLSRELLQQYRYLFRGWNRLTLADGRITLTLLIGDVMETLPFCDMAVDAWFLDGFAPAKNPDMWRPDLFQAMARLSAPGATFATFTSAGAVKRGLEEAGFAVEKTKGHGRKREMLCGRLARSPERPWQAPWYSSPPPLEVGRAAVIGGGIAGAATAAALAQRGWDVCLVERHGALAAEGSGNPQGILYAKLSPHPTPLTSLTLAGYGHTLRLLDSLLPADGQVRAACGVLQLAYDDAEAKRLEALAATDYGEGLMRPVGAAEASELADIPLRTGGLFFPDGGWIHPPALVAALAENKGIRVLPTAEAIALHQDDSGWHLMGREGELAQADLVVFAAAGDSAAFDQTSYLPIHRNRGQVTVLPATTASRRLATVLCGESYIAPPRGTTHTLGATYAPFDGHLDVTAPDHETNLGNLNTLAPALYAALGAEYLDTTGLAGRTSLRAVAADHLPIVGGIVDAERFNALYAPLSRDAKRKLNDPAPWQKGLYINAAHGSRGMLTAPVAAELLASQIAGEPLPLPATLAPAIHPSRFPLRSLIRAHSGRSEALI